MIVLPLDQLISTFQTGSDGGYPPPSQDPDRLKQAKVEVSRGKTEVSRGKAEMSQQQLRVGLPQLPEDHGTAEGSEPQPCRGETKYTITDRGSSKKL